MEKRSGKEAVQVFVTIVSLGLACGLFSLMREHSDQVWQWVTYVAIAAGAGAVIYAVSRFVYWRDQRIAEQHERWYANGAENSVRILVEAIKGEAERQTSFGRVTAEILKVLKSSGGFDQQYPLLPLGGQNQLPDDGKIVDVDWEIGGLDDDDKWQ